MKIDYHNSRHFDGDLEGVLYSFFNAKAIKQVYDGFFFETLGEQKPKKKLKKSDMVDRLCSLLEDADLMQKFVDSIEDQVRIVYERLLWSDYCNMGTLESELGFELHTVELDLSWGSRYEAISLQPKFCLIAHETTGGAGYGQELGPSNFQLRMPPAIRRWLKPYFPRPEGYEIIAIAEGDSFLEAHGPNTRSFDASSTIYSDIVQLSDFLTRGTYARTKKGTLTKASLRKAEKLIGSAEWYADNKERPELSTMRIEILLDFIEAFSPKTVERLAAAQPDPKIFKTLLAEIASNCESLEKWLLSHLKQRYKYYESASEPSALANLFDLFKKIPHDGWVTTENLKTAQFYQDIDICFFESGRYSFRAITGSRYSYETEIELEGPHLQKLGIEPLIDCTAFILSAFGYIELAYTLPPKHPNYSKEKTPYMTRFDGAVAVRLTDVGAYAFGRTSSLKIKNDRRERIIIKPHPDHLHLTCGNLDPITEQALQEYMEPIGPNFYKMTRASMLKGCKSPKDLKQRIETFKRRIPAQFPPNWQAFFERLANETRVLIKEPQLTVFTLDGPPDLTKRFLTDPILRRLTTRVEGHRVAIASEDIPKVSAHLRKLGYLT